MIGVTDVIIIVFVVLALIGVGLYFLSRRNSQKYVESQNMIQKTKKPFFIYVIEKKKEKISDSNLPKEVKANVPKIYRIMKANTVKAKIGNQVMTLMCDPKVYDALPVRKNVKVEIAGIYIVEMKGMKTKKEIREMAKSKKKAAGAESEKWYEKYNPAKLLKK
ncbi:MAG: hypothetical protein LBU32_25145 [Clostridiales bacterium]|nr:hypothetical protein [Clostridiales bacterium]